MPRTIFITDAASPLGKACAVRLGRAGWNIAMGASSLTALRGVCDALPDHTTLPARCVATDIANVIPVLDAAEAKFGSIDAVLMNSRARRSSWRRVIDTQVLSLATISEATRPYLRGSAGHLVVAGVRGGPRSMSGAMQTVARNASRTIAAALTEDWDEEPMTVSLVEPDGLDSPKQMARRIARVLNGAPGRTVLHGAALSSAQEFAQ